MKKKDSRIVSTKSKNRKLHKLVISTLTYCGINLNNKPHIPAIRRSERYEYKKGNFYERDKYKKRNFCKRCWWEE